MKPYQVMPDLKAEEFESLKADILLNGVQVPVEVDENGIILDGHHRALACAQLGIAEYPRLIRPGLSHEQKMAHAVRLNIHRRHLDSKQRREFVATLLKAEPDSSNRKIADDAGVSHNTVSAVRDELESTGQIDQFIKTIGRDGKARPAILVTSDRQQERVLSKLDKQPALVGSVITERDLDKAVKDQDRVTIKAVGLVVDSTEPAERRQVKPGEWWRLGRHLLYCGDTSDTCFVEKVPGCAFAFADPPYNAEKAEWDKDFNWRHDWLAARAEVVAVTPGIASIAEFFKRTKMPYKWTFACWIDNGMARGAMGFGNHILALLFSGGSLYRTGGHQDFTRTTINNADAKDTTHPSRKPAGLVAHLVSIFSEEDDVVCDPFIGSGTTLLVCETMNRVCIAGDINPDYCSEVISRWEQVTQLKAEREAIDGGNGLPLR